MSHVTFEQIDRLVVSASCALLVSRAKSRNVWSDDACDYSIGTVNVNGAIGPQLLLLSAIGRWLDIRYGLIRECDIVELISWTSAGGNFVVDWAQLQLANIIWG